MGRERRRRNRRTPRTAGPARPVTFATSDAIPEGVDEAPARAVRRPAPAAAPVHVRADRVVARESADMMAEVRRVLTVSSVCLGMLAVLVIVERFAS